MIRFTVMAAAYVEYCNPQVRVRKVSGMDRVEAIVEQFRQIPTAPVPQPATRRRRRCWFLLALVPLVIVAALVMRPAADVVTEPETDWRAEVHRIDTARMRAFMERNPELLRSILVVGSPAYTHDIALMQDLNARHVVLDRDPFELISVTLRTRSETNGVQRVQLDVVDRLTSHSFLSDSNTIALNRGRGEREWLIELRRQEDARWRLYSATAAVSKSSTRASDQGN